MSVRKRVFAHAVRLPLHRVQELKSGGAASILRQDAGSVGELVFGMLYNPWRAIIQLVGSLCMLAWVDWRLLLGALLLIPLVYLTHRTWISRIRPQYRRVRDQREEVDALATESFGGMRVVRAFGRQRAETNRIFAAIMSWAGRSCTRGGGCEPSRSSGKRSFRWPARHCCCTAEGGCWTESSRWVT